VKHDELLVLDGHSLTLEDVRHVRAQSQGDLCH